MGINYKENNQWKEVKVKVGDNIPVGAEMDYDGNTIPVGWEEIDNPNNYSTDEVVVGAWITGKPLYKKTIECGTLPNNTTKEIDLNISNFDKVHKLEGIAETSTTQIPLPLPSTTLASNIFLYVQNGKLYIVTGENRSNLTGYVTVYYTKTTD